jgi:DNA-binding winged helix-turn-helix (wHTH) protein/tetratricopeptide (TPR) repeat protein
MKRPLEDLSRPSLPGYSFAEFRLEADGTLWRDQSVVHLAPKELAALQLLLAHAGRIVSPLQLKHELWGEVHVAADSVPKCLSSLRSKLEPTECIQTVYKRGYRFAAEVSRIGYESDKPLPRLAILPFTTEYAVPDHLGLGIAEEMIAHLTNMSQPVVAMLARDSVFALAQYKHTAQQIGETLGADLVMTGALRAQTGHFRLRAEMIRINDGTQIWVEDLLVSQSQIASLEVMLVQRLLQRMNSSSLTIDAAAAPTQERERNPQHREAYEIYLRAHHEWQSMQRHCMQDGLQNLMRSVALDPRLTAARTDVAHLCTAQSIYGFLPPKIATAHIRRMAEPTPDLPQGTEAALPALAWVRFHVDHDLAGALLTFDQCAHLPHDLWTTHLRVLLALSRQHFPEAIEMLRAAMRMDPFSPWLHARLAWALYLGGQSVESVAHINQTVTLFPQHEGVAFYGSLILGACGEAERAIQLLKGMTHKLSYFDLATATHACALANAGHRDEARNILERLQWLSRERYVISSFLPAIHISLGDMESALTELQTAHDARCPWFFQMLSDPRLKPLHGHPEFERMQAILPRLEAEAAAVYLEPFGEELNEVFA